MKEIIIDTLMDSVKMLPFLFISYLIIEYIEHKSSKKLEKILSTSGKFSTIAGALLGCIPQCGFSLTASNLYASRVISLGTLLAVFLSTSDEAIPVLLSHPQSGMSILKIIITKLIIAIIIGFLIDFIMKKLNKKDHKHEVDEHIHEMCSHCDCEHGILKSTIKHTIEIFIFLIIVIFLLNIAIHYIGEENLSKFLMTGNIFQPFIAGIIGLIPNCASSVLLTELYISGNISFASIIAGLSAGAGMGTVVLFRSNKNIKENLKIVLLLYLAGSISGFIIELIGFLI
ncbi:MAG: putative manganese transporter [Clostridia bacterium]|nr:putative manganese transporter [Clostridia bacterium]